MEMSHVCIYDKLSIVLINPVIIIVHLSPEQFFVRKVVKLILHTSKSLGYNSVALGAIYGYKYHMYAYWYIVDQRGK